MTPGSAFFGVLPTGEDVERVTISDGQLSASILTYGAILQDVRLAGIPYSLTIGSTDLGSYLGPLEYCGPIIGPVVNRIADSKAQIAGTEFTFKPNTPKGHLLHSGDFGTHRKLWTKSEQSPTSVSLELRLPDQEGGFPGDRNITARYSVHDAALRLDITAETTRPTLFNFANHSYWRLAEGPTYRGHFLKISAQTALNTNLVTGLPNGETIAVAGRHLDFRTPSKLTANPSQALDHNFCLASEPKPLRPVAWLRAKTGVTLELSTTLPGLQVFDGHSLKSEGFLDNDQQEISAYAGLALETQFWPNAPRHPHFPKIEVGPGQIWAHSTRWQFHRP